MADFQNQNIKRILTFVFFLLFFYNSNAQKDQQEESEWNSRFNLNFGFNAPFGKWKQTPSLDATLADAYLQNTGFGVGNGGSFEIGNVFFLNMLPEVMNDKLKFAFNTSWLDVNLMPIKAGWQKAGEPFKDCRYTPFFFLGVKFGALASYNWYKDNFVDLYFNYNPTASIAGSIRSGGNSATSFHGWGLGFGNRYTAGINYRILVFNVGAEFILGHINYNAHININTYSKSIEHNFATKFNTNTFRLKFGFSF
jgi:hypothetical protein